jgi:RimJ/RimL family protein N-acetyltransferase
MSKGRNEMTLTQQPTITTEHFVLRPLRTSDAGLIELYSSDERVARMTNNIAHPLPPGATQALLMRANDPKREQDIWAIDMSHKGGPDLIGLIMLNRLDESQSEVTGWVAPAFWNTGAASQAVNNLIENNPLGNKAIFASVFQDNPVSAKVLISAGFDYIGDAETFSVARSANVPTWTYLRKLN